MNSLQEQQLKTVTAETLGVDTQEITDESSPETLHAWTSLSHLTLMAAVEDAFGLMFSMEDMAGVHNYGELSALVAKSVA